MTKTFFGAEMNCRETEFIEAHIRAFGIWEPGVCDVLMRTIEPGDTFVDIGANIGHHALLGSFLVGSTGTVVACEPEPGNCNALYANIALNSAKNIRVEQRAVAAKAGPIYIHSGPDFNRGLATSAPLAHVQYGPRYAVAAVPLDTLLYSGERRKTRVLKIDIEGGEVPVLAQLLHTLDGYPMLRHIVAEVSEQTPVKLWQDLLPHFELKGFRALQIRNGYSPAFYTDWQGPEPLPTISHITGQCDLLLTRDRSSIRPTGGFGYVKTKA